MTIYLVRTGETTWDAEGRVRGRVDVPLTASGEAESAATGEALAAFRPAAIYCAPGESAGATARLLAKALDSRPRVLEALADVDFGLWQGMLWREVAKRHRKTHRRLLDDPLTVTPPEGEPLTEVLRRVRDGLAALAGRHGRESIVLVCSADVCAFVRASIEGVRVEPPRPLAADGGQWWAIEVPPAQGGPGDA